MATKRGYEEVLALEFFKRAIENYDCKQIGEEMFEPLVRNLEDERVVFACFDKLYPRKQEGDDQMEDYQPWRRRNRDGSAAEACAVLWGCATSRARFREWVLNVVEGLLCPLRRATADDPLRGRIEELKTTLHLNDDELDITLVLWLLATERMEVASRAYTTSRVTGFLNLCTGISEQSVRALLTDSGRLCRYGVVGRRDHVDIQPKIRCFLDGINDEPLVSSFYRKDAEEPLPMDFFGEMAKKHVPLLKKLIAARGERGVNILLYGAPGTGKTSFARALAKAVGRTCYQIEQRPKDQEGDYRPAKAEIRFAALEICNEQVVSGDSVIVVDEADALLRCTNLGLFAMFGASSSVTGDKGLLNDILEKNQVPTIWITNTSAAELDLSNRRRFDYSIRFDPLTKEQRIDIWRNAATKAGMSGMFARKDIERLVERYPLNAGIVARALENAARVCTTRKERLETVERLLERQCELSGTDERVDEPVPVASDYSLEGLNIKSRIALDKVIVAARRFLDARTSKGDRDAPRMNILLSGVPGSGKTEFVKYFASQLGRRLCVCRPSDLKSKWVGETEQRIAAAFREAKERGAVLFFDEVDSFLDNREALSQGHEKSMVNEVLQQMEGFGGIFIGTTNYAGMLDPAVARRFTFKIELDYLTNDGKRVFFRRFFNRELSADDDKTLSRIECLTPGDFRTVRQELYYLGDEVSNSERLAALEEEVQSRSVAHRAKIGF